MQKEDVAQQAPTADEVSSSPEVEAKQRQDTPEQTADEAATEEKKPEEPKPPRWYRQAITARDRTIGELKAQQRALEERLSGLQKPEDVSSEGGKVSGIDREELQKGVIQAAKAIAEADRFNDKCNEVNRIGVEKYGKEFRQAIEGLWAASDKFDDVLPSLVESDDPARIIHYLGTNLDEAAEILALPDRQMVRAIAKLEARLGEQKTTTKSNAAKPLEPLKPSANVDRDPSKMTDAEWARYRKQKVN